jgi:hypothetical protein
MHSILVQWCGGGIQILSKIISEGTTVRHYARSVGTLPNKGNNIREFSIKYPFPTRSIVNVNMYTCLKYVIHIGHNVTKLGMDTVWWCLTPLSYRLSGFLTTRHRKEIFWPPKLQPPFSYSLDEYKSWNYASSAYHHWCCFLHEVLSM